MYINSVECHGGCDDDDANDQYWIGLEKEGPNRDENKTKRREGWTWMDGTVYIWMNWEDKTGKPEPSGEDGCVRMLYNGKWKDIDRVENYRYLCEKGITFSI